MSRGRQAGEFVEYGQSAFLALGAAVFEQIESGRYGFSFKTQQGLEVDRTGRREQAYSESSLKSTLSKLWSIIQWRQWYG